MRGCPNQTSGLGFKKNNYETFNDETSNFTMSGGENFKHHGNLETNNTTRQAKLGIRYIRGYF